MQSLFPFDEWKLTEIKKLILDEKLMRIDEKLIMRVMDKNKH